ncbi:GntR family transcriptional regulator [Sphingomonas sp. BIUV-7]|uniref:GntR family transcriptional regulator n=1 Tax=Sphingomonas natans TaxID=3063330 RepID=A0ABT8YAT7_9SPHN|nr:GntR family transcriptional regulator [Sphingomonas sp. BIUV-7]MDO6415430.1 GntR family transcriptional regulator [Sphingomonas sp. BIUV-7]
MSPEPVAGERVYRRLRDLLMGGAYHPGDLLPLQRLADELGTSVSPVRDAVHRLVGERVLLAGQGGGFNVPILSADDVWHLYTWHAELLRLALRDPLPPATQASISTTIGQSDHADALAHSSANLFGAFATASGNAEIIHAIANASLRLHAARLCEPKFIKGIRQELESIAHIAKTGPAGTVRRAVSEYHRRRLRRSARIANAIKVITGVRTSL